MSRISVELATDDPVAVRAITEYWAQDDLLAFTHRVADIAAALGIRTRDVAPLVTRFSRASVPAWPCSGCGGVRPLGSREAYTRARASRSAWYCRSCEERLADEADAVLRARIREQHPGSPGTATTPAGLVDQLFLASLAQTGERGAPGTAGPLTDADPPLSPTAYMDVRILARLHERGDIAVDPESAPEAFEWDEWDRPEGFDPLLVRWRVSGIPFMRDALLASLTERDQAALLRLCGSILVQECFQFLDLILARNGLPFFAGRGTRELFERLLEHFSVAQVYNLIWRSAREVVAYSDRVARTPEHTGAAVVHEISRKGEFTRVSGQALKPYRRDWGAPRSRLGEVVFDRLLDLGEDTAFLTPWGTLQALVAERAAVAG
jgi:hypothetical protein